MTTARFSAGLTETFMGPSIGSAADGLELLLKARDGDASVADALTFGSQNMIFANLFYVRPALDYLWINGMRDAASPGYLKRQATRRRNEYGQESFVPKEAFPELFK